MTDTVSADADPVSDYSGSQLQGMIDHRREQVAKAKVRYARAAGRVKPWRIAVSLAMSSLRTESVIDHAGPVSDHPNPVIDHKVLTEAISRTKRTSNCRPAMSQRNVCF
jgi:hypothetical protein